MPSQLFNDSVRLLGNVLNYRVDRHSLLASNLANIETPNYKTKDIAFEQALQAALPDPNQLRMVRTHARHLPLYDASGRVRSQVVTGGEVDIDKQMAKLAENNLMYNAMVQLLSGKYRAIRETIEQGGR
ncbi:MAG: flagellar basal body rod protein FlgB [Deltaproteobacteria bacterium]|nr:flagellar basal body rod protein FlgB [Deltaproteobacteria bacterium]